MKKILILGAQGNLGQQLVKVFSASPFVIPSEAKRSREIPCQLQSRSLDYARDDELWRVIAWDRAEIDLGNREELRRKILEARPEVIINAAAYNNVDKAETEPALARLINGEAVGWLAELCRELGATIVHYSTDYVFKGDRPAGYNENDAPEPPSAYAKSKFLGEQKILAIQPKFYLIRTSRLFGPLASAIGAKPSFVDTILTLAKEKPMIEVVAAEVSSPTYTPDLARATRQLLTSYSPGIYHLTNSGAGTWSDWAKSVLELTKSDTIIKPVPADKFPRPAPRPAYSILLNTKLPPLRPWQEALKEYLSKSHPERSRGI